MNCESIIEVEGKECRIRNPEEEGAEPKVFTFDHCYYLGTQQVQLYDDIEGLF